MIPALVFEICGTNEYRKQKAYTKLKEEQEQTEKEETDNKKKELKEEKVLMIIPF